MSLFLHNLVTLHFLADGDSQARPNTIYQSCGVGTSKHECASVEKVGVASSLAEPDVMEKRHQQRSVDVKESCHDGMAKVWTKTGQQGAPVRERRGSEQGYVSGNSEIILRNNPGSDNVG
jgi:hypothetical protein